MATKPSAGEPAAPPRRDPWREHIRFSSGRPGAGFAFRPGELIADAAAVDMVKAMSLSEVSVYEITRPLVLITGVADPLAAAAALRQRGFRAEPNYVVFASS